MYIWLYIKHTDLAPNLTYCMIPNVFWDKIRAMKEASTKIFSRLFIYSTFREHDIFKNVMINMFSVQNQHLCILAGSSFFIFIFTINVLRDPIIDLLWYITQKPPFGHLGSGPNQMKNGHPASQGLLSLLLDGLCSWTIIWYWSEERCSLLHKHTTLHFISTLPCNSSGLLHSRVLRDPQDGCALNRNFY